MNLQAVAEEGMPKLVLMLRKGVKGFFFFAKCCCSHAYYKQKYDDGVMPWP